MLAGVAAEAGSAGNLYLSPHYDDIAFSLGAALLASPGGVLVDLFTRTGYVAGAPTDVPDPAEAERISRLRQLEDDRFARRCNLEVIRLDLEEPGLRGRRSRDATGLADDVGQLREPLFALLDRLAAGRRVFCPAAVGGHVNHLATRAVVIEWLRRASAGSRVAFYEDLPYAASRRARRAGLAELRRLAGAGLRRRAWRAGRDKLELINMYPSQHAVPVTAFKEFSPATWWPPVPHEAIWEWR